MPADPVVEVYERIESTRSDEHHELWLGYLKTASGSNTPVVLGDLRLPMLDNVDNAVVNVCTRPAISAAGLRHCDAAAPHCTCAHARPNPFDRRDL